MNQETHYPMIVSIVVHSATELRAVYGLLGTAAGAGVTIAKQPDQASQDAGSKPIVDKVASVAGSVAAGGVPKAETEVPVDTSKVDAAGTPFDPARHTGTIVKSGLWRMKAGLARGPGEGEDSIPGNGTGTATTGAASKPTDTADVQTDEDDEFAAFAAANNKGGAAAPTARSWSDQDLSKLNNAAAQKLGSADQIKPIVAAYIPAGSVQHSRHIPVEKREEYAQKIEALAGIEFEG